MSLELLNIVEIIELMENYMAKIRPPEDMRDEYDISYKIDNQSIILQEVRPLFPVPGEKREYGFAKATYVKTVDKWKVYWMRSSGKWNLYDPTPEVNSLAEFLTLVEEDRYHCFYG